MSRYMLGIDPVEVYTTVYDNTVTPAVLVDASTIILTVQKPDASQQVYASPTHDSVGTYHQIVPVTDLSQLGHYSYVWKVTGTGAGGQRGDFDVYDPFEVALLSLQDAKQALNITSTSQDSEIQGMVDTITASIEMYTGGPVVTRSVSERVSITADYTTLAVRKGPLVAVTSITDITSGTASPLTDLDVDTNSGLIRRKLRLPFLGWGPYYTVVYTAGWGTVVPPSFAQAARIIIAHLWATQRGPQPRPYGGAEETVLPGMSYAIPNIAAELLRPFVCEAYV